MRGDANLKSLFSSSKAGFSEAFDVHQFCDLRDERYFERCSFLPSLHSRNNCARKKFAKHFGLGTGAVRFDSTRFGCIEFILFSAGLTGDYWRRASVRIRRSKSFWRSNRWRRIGRSEMRFDPPGATRRSFQPTPPNAFFSWAGATSQSSNTF